MKYFDLTTVVDSYLGFQDCMTNKSWGFLALLKGCCNTIQPFVTYKVDLDSVSNFLESTFCLNQNKKNYNSRKTLFAVFSNKWEQYFKEQGKKTANIYDVAVWAYRRQSFSDKTTINDILEKFITEFNISQSVISNCFDTKPKNLNFTGSLYAEDSLKTALYNNGVNISKENIDAQKNGVVAAPGEISRGPFIQTLYAGLDITDYVLILQSDYKSLYSRNKKQESSTISLDEPLLKIVYGAPGTGKSHGISKIVDNRPDENVFRVTFHPDSDYSTFVGCYKPMTKDIEMRDVAGHRIVEDGDYVITNNIVYEFVPQAFINAYVRAYETTEPVFLVIEEINRGNCAQIFGDIFQLLDREDSGWSSYAVKPDTDLAQYLKKRLGDKYDENKGMKLPPNLYIWATMNTSDQSLFPIDSAFKRRWDWEYMPIEQGKDEDGSLLQWKIKVGEAEYDWWSFLTIINDIIAADPSLGEDKQLGYFFCKAKEGIIDEKMFINKVCFYLWNDVFKDFLPTHKALQMTDENSKSRNIRFTDFFKAGHTALIKNFLKELGVKDIDEEEDEDGNNKFTPPSKRDYTKYKINGEGRFGKNKLASECVKKYIELNPEVSVETVLSEWKGLDMKVPHFIESKEEYDARTDNSKRSVEIKCGDTVIYVAHNGYGSNGKAPLLMEKINEKGWGIKVEEIKDKEA